MFCVYWNKFTSINDKENLMFSKLTIASYIERGTSFRRTAFHSNYLIQSMNEVRKFDEC